MEKMFCLGVMLGALGGALLVANSFKMRSLVKKSQAEFVDRVNEMIDERLACGANGREQEQKDDKKEEKKEKKK